MKIQLNRSEVLENGFAKAPTAAQLSYGELAINYDDGDPTLFYKDNSDTIRSIKLAIQPDLTVSANQSGTLDDRYLKLSGGTLTGDLTGTNFIGGVSRISSSPPTPTGDGELWFNTDDGRLYIYYTDGNGDSQWVDAAPDTYDLLLTTNYYSKTESDARYLGISATAANSTLLDGQAASYYLDYNNFVNTPTISGTDLSYTSSTRLLESSTGTDVTLPEVVAGGDSGLMTGAQATKLDGIETGATADQTGAEIKAAYEAEADTNAFDDAAVAKLAGIETSATGDQTGAEIKALYEGEADTNAFTDTEKTKLSGIEDNATADQTGAEIKAAYEGEADTNAFTDAEKTKLAGIETGAQVNTVTSVNGQTGAVTINGTTDLSYTASTRELASSTGNNVILPEVAAAGDSGLMTGSDKTKLDDIDLTGASDGQALIYNSTSGNFEAGDISAGFTVSSATPSSPSNGDTYYDTDDATSYIYVNDGGSSQWVPLSPTQHTATDLTYTSATRVLASSTGNDAILPEVVANGDSGLMTGADKDKLDDIDLSGATDGQGLVYNSSTSTFEPGDLAPQVLIVDGGNFENGSAIVTTSTDIDGGSF